MADDPNVKKYPGKGFTEGQRQGNRLRDRLRAHYESKSPFSTGQIMALLAIRLNDPRG